MSTTAIPRHPVRRSAATVRAASRVALKPDALRLSLCILTILNISRVHQRFAWLSLLRPGMTLLIIALLSAFTNPRALADPSWIRRWPARTVAGLGIWTLGSIAFGISQGGAFYFFQTVYWKILVCTILLMAALRNARDMYMIVWSYVIGCGILTWMALFVFRTVAEGDGIARLEGMESWDANDVCVLLLMGLGFCFLLLRMAKPAGKVAAGIIAAGIGTVIARSGSRGGFLGLACVLFAYIVSMKGAAKLRGFAIVSVIGIALAAGAPEGYWEQMGTILSPKQDYNWESRQGRRQLTIRGVGYALAYPVFGVGVGNFGRAEGTISNIADEEGVRWSAAHNSYIQAGAELGIPGFLMFCGMVAGCIIVPWRWRKRIPPSWENGSWDEQALYQFAVHMPLAAIGFAAPAYFVSFAYVDPVYILVALTGGFMLAVEARLAGSGVTRAGPVAGRSSMHRPSGVSASENTSRRINTSSIPATGTSVPTRGRRSDGRLA